MNYAQFIGYLDHGPDAGGTAALQAFVAEYPFCQTARILYSRLLTDQQDAGAESAVRLAALYAGDRALLRRYLSGATLEEMTPGTASAFPTLEQEEPVPLLSPETEEAAAPGDETPLSPEADTEPVLMPVAAAFAGDDDSSAEDHVAAGETEDPHEIIRRRLNEIFAARQEAPAAEPPRETAHAPVTEETGEASLPFAAAVEPAPVETNAAAEVPAQPPVAERVPPQERPVPQALPAEKEEVILRKEMMQMKDEVDRDELAHAAEETILQALEREAVPKKETGGQDFFSWLRGQHGGRFGRVEELRNQPAPALTTYIPGSSGGEAPVPAAAASSQSLIDQFIASEPRITPSKAEFYSPAMQARRSVEEDLDLVSETLAEIFLEQGLLEKARAAYERLRLLVPEKSASFAARIEEIDKKLNEEE
jgi:hypothetical protein